MLKKQFSLFTFLSLILISGGVFSQEANISRPDGMDIDHTGEVQTSPSSDIQIPTNLQNEEPDFVYKTASNVGTFFSGCLNAVCDMVSDPFLQVYDSATGLYYYFTDNKEAVMVWEPKSATWKAWKQGMSPSDQLYAMGSGLINLPWEFLEAIDSGNAQKAGYTLTNIAAIALPVGHGLSKISFPARTLEFLPVIQQDGSMVLAVSTAQAITIDGVALERGVLLSLMISETNGSDAPKNPPKKLKFYPTRKSIQNDKTLFRGLLEGSIKASDTHKILIEGVDYFYEGNTFSGDFVNSQTGEVIGHFKVDGITRMHLYGIFSD